MKNIKKRICTRFSNSGATKITLVFLTDENISLKIDEISEKGNFKHLRGERTSKDVLPTKEEIEKFITYSMSVNKKNEEEKIKREKEEKEKLEKESLFLSKKIIEGEEKEYRGVFSGIMHNLCKMYQLQDKTDIAVVVLYVLGELKLKKINDDSYYGRDFNLDELLLEIHNGHVFTKKEHYKESTESFIYFDDKLKFKISFEESRIKGRYNRAWKEADFSDFDFKIERL